MERLLEAHYAGNTPKLINEKLGQVQKSIQELKIKLSAIGSLIERGPTEESARLVTAAIMARVAHLHGLRQLIDMITLPVDDSPVVLHALGREFELDVPLQRKRRT